jgi:hypothetical protein
MAFEQDVDRWVRELRDAGWTEYRSTIWKAPGGELFRGPYHAWQIMTQRKKPVEESSTGGVGK